MITGKNSLVILLLCIVLACNKPLPDYSNQPFAYTVSGGGDVTVPANDMSYFSLAITAVTGNPTNHNITVVFNGLPPHVTIADSITFRASYQLPDSFVATGAPQGTYPIQAIFYSPGMDTIVDTFNLIIGPPLNRVAGLAGGFYGSNSCSDDAYIGAFIDSIPGAPYRCMLLEHLSSSFYTASAWWDTTYCVIDSFANKLTIPSQIVHGATITGSGSFSPGGNVVLTRIFVTDTSAYSCTITLSATL